MLDSAYGKYGKVQNKDLEGITKILAKKLSDLNPEAHFVAVAAGEIHSNTLYKYLEHINLPEHSYLRVDKRPAYGLAWITVNSLKFKIETFV